MSNYSESVLLYPNISLDNPVLIKEALLLYDNIYRICPWKESPHDNKEIRNFMNKHDNNIVSSIDPYKYANDLVKKFDNLGDFLSKFSSNNDDLSDRIHVDKFNHEFLFDLRKRGLLKKSDNSWDYGYHEVIHQYMALLSNEIASRNNLGLLTNDISSWSIQECLNNYNNFKNHQKMGFNGPIPIIKQYFKKIRNNSTDARNSQKMNCSNPHSIIGLYLKDYIPDNINEISFQEIIEFRDDFKKERRNFLNTQKEAINTLQNIEEPCVFENELNNLQSKLDDSFESYQNAVQTLGPNNFFGLKVVTCPVIVNLTGFICNLDEPLTRTLGAIGASFGIMWSLYSYYDDRDKLRKSNPYSYLDILKSTDFNRRYQDSDQLETIRQINTKLSKAVNHVMPDEISYNP